MQDENQSAPMRKGQDRTSGGGKGISLGRFRKDGERCGRLHLKMRQRFISAAAV